MMSDAKETNNSRISREETKPQIYKPPVRGMSNRKLVKPANEPPKDNKPVTSPVEEEPKPKVEGKALRSFEFDEMAKQAEEIKPEVVATPDMGLLADPLFTRGDKKRHTINYSFINTATHTTTTTTSDSKDLNMTTSTLSNGTFKNFSFIGQNFEELGNRLGEQGLFSSFIDTTEFDSFDADHDSTVNLEDLMLLEEKLADIITAVSSNLETTHQCYEWWNLFFNCSLYGKFQDYFKDDKQKQSLRDYENLELIAVMLCYDMSTLSTIHLSTNTLLKTTLGIVHRNYLILCDYIVSKVNSESLKNIWVIRLNKLLNEKLTVKLTKGQHITEIMVGNESLTDYTKVVAKNIVDNEKRETMSSFLKTLNHISTNNLNDFFQRKILKIGNRKASEVASVALESGYKQKSVPFPYITEKTSKDYTLVLDLDETLIHFKADPDGKTGSIKLRPGLYDFLENVRKYYELIIFTASTQEVRFKSLTFSTLMYYSMLLTRVKGTSIIDCIDNMRS
jgi:hypothetical protein